MADKKNINQYKMSKASSRREIADMKKNSFKLFREKHLPKRSHLIALNSSMDNMHRDTGHSRELLYHSFRDAFCYMNEVVLPETYQGFREAKKRHEIL
jgi:DNA-binding phage protein